MNTLNLFYGIFGLAAVNLVFGYLKNQLFLAQTRSISSFLDLHRFKQLARQNMYLALLQLVLLRGGFLLGIYGWFTGRHSGPSGGPPA